MRPSMVIRARRSAGPARARHIFGSRRTASASRRSICSAQASRCWLRGRAQPGVQRRVKQRAPASAIDAGTSNNPLYANGLSSRAICMYVDGARKYARAP